jgi:hypothetical protein
VWEATFREKWAELETIEASAPGIDQALGGPDNRFEETYFDA